MSQQGLTAHLSCMMRRRERDIRLHLLASGGEPQKHGDVTPGSFLMMRYYIQYSTCISVRFIRKPHALDL